MQVAHFLVSPTLPVYKIRAEPRSIKLHLIFADVFCPSSLFSSLYSLQKENGRRGAGVGDAAAGAATAAQGEYKTTRMSERNRLVCLSVWAPNLDSLLSRV